MKQGEKTGCRKRGHIQLFSSWLEGDGAFVIVIIRLLDLSLSLSLFLSRRKRRLLLFVIHSLCRLLSLSFSLEFGVAQKHWRQREEWPAAVAVSSAASETLMAPKVPFISGLFLSVLSCLAGKLPVCLSVCMPILCHCLATNCGNSFSSFITFFLRFAIPQSVSVSEFSLKHKQTHQTDTRAHTFTWIHGHVSNAQHNAQDTALTVRLFQQHPLLFDVSLSFSLSLSIVF